MKTFEVILTKSYIVNIKAENEEKAKRYAEFFTSDIIDLSTAEDREKLKFQIDDIDCTINEAVEVKRITNISH
jgi:hypothetical protein